MDATTEDQLTPTKIIELIRRQGTIEQCKSFLKSRNLSSSAGNWDEMAEGRLYRHYSSGALTVDDLYELLSQVEEHGGQHILFYELLPGRRIETLFDKPYLHEKIEELGLPPLGVPSYEAMPSIGRVTEVRLEEGSRDTFLIIKIVQKRFERENFSEQYESGRIIQTFDETPVRAVNIIRISRSGHCEIRLQSHQDAHSYVAEAEGVFNLVRDLVNRYDWREVDLSPARESFFDPKKRPRMQESFHLRGSNLRNDAGFKVGFNTGNPTSDLYNSAPAVASIDAFYAEKRDNPSCDRLNVAVKAAPDFGARRSINVVFHAGLNEISVQSRLTKIEFEHAIECIIKINS